MPTLQSNGIETYYEVHGAGTPVLFAAGMAGLGSFWREQVGPFAEHYQVIVYDQRGTGQTDRVPVDSVEQLTADLVELMDGLEIENAHFVGHSTGGAIGQVMALERPERLRSLTLACSLNRPDPYRRRVWAARRGLLESLGPKAYVNATSLFLYPSRYVRDNDERLRADEAKAVAGFPPVPVMLSRIEAIGKFDRTAELANIRTPTLVIGAKDDIQTPPYFSEALADAIDNAALIMFDYGAHAAPRTVPDEFNRHVLDFIAACGN